ncbi:arylsulfatase [uncultured Formosa sp.]|uniref:arylsulfatase n=1 Tax=uncultured Formosa sp. TaxID=255435 RepID=UPI00260963D4|nr:arylsulfatase [uncultured Formosa sp.]
MIKKTLPSVILFISFFLWNNPEIYAQAFNRAVKTSENFEPAIPHPDQEKAVAKKLLDLEKKMGKKPNIVWIVIDDMGYGDPGCYGGGAAIGAATPNMDKIATEGLRLTSTYSQQTCTPTRAAILTGRLPVRSGLTRPILSGDKITANPWEDEVSLPKLLGNAGYNTLLTGKWHVGEIKGMRPHDIGFDEFYGYYSAPKEISQGVDTHRYPDLTMNEDYMITFNEIRTNPHLIHGYKNGSTEEISEVKSLDDIGSVDQVLTDFTVEKIEELAKSDKPFFLEHAFLKVHADNQDNPNYPGLSKAKYQYKNGVVEVDMHIGNIVKALEAAGVLENTFIFITSDNGPQMDAWPDAGYTPFRGAKGTTFEGGVRVPGIAYWKGMISAGRQSDGVFDLMDLFGTSLRLAGVSADKLPNDKYFDYIDQSSFLFNDEGESNRESVYFWWGKELMAIRIREYKQHIKVIKAQAPHMWIDYATIEDVGLAPWTFNLYIDPKENMPVGHRRTAWLATLGSQLKVHAATFKKYPPKQIGL